MSGVKRAGLALSESEGTTANMYARGNRISARDLPAFKMELYNMLITYFLLSGYAITLLQAQDRYDLPGESYPMEAPGDSYSFNYGPPGDSMYEFDIYGERIGLSKNISCEERSSCPHGEKFTNFLEKNCMCDELCGLFHDCCENIHPLEPHRNLAIEQGSFLCIMPYKLIPLPPFSVYIVHKCPSNYHDHLIASKCDSRNDPDYLLSWPVIGRTTNILFANVYCAICNGDTNTEFLQSDVQCQIIPPKEIRKDFKKVFSAENLDHHLCDIKFVLPTDAELRHCKDAVSECSPGGVHDDTLVNMCHNHTSYVYSMPNTVYKNRYCALCNDVHEMDILCEDPNLQGSVGDEGSLVDPPFSILLDINSGKFESKRVGSVQERTAEEVITEVKQCPANHVYDPYRQQCRAFVFIPGPPPYMPDGAHSGFVGFSNMTEYEYFWGCPLVHLNFTDFLMYGNRSIFVYSEQRMYNELEYFINGSVVVICSELSSNFTVSRNVSSIIYIFKFDKGQYYVSLVGLIISITALFILLVIYSILPPLRNIPGKCLMSLAASVLLAQLLFVAGVSRTEVFEVCVSIAVLMHYSFLAGFFWMNVMAFDIWKTFGTKSLQTGVGERSLRFFLYSLYAWLLPAIIIIVAMILEHTDVEGDYRPNYADGMCWITNRPALIVLFAIPLAILLIVNIIFYIVTVRAIVLISRATRIVKKSEKRRFLLYVKLCVIMGLTWVFAFVAAFSDVQVLWYLFIIFNTLQGLFICLAFICTKKVYRLLKEKIGGGGKHVSFDSGTKSINSTKNTIVSNSSSGRPYVAMATKGSGVNRQKSNSSKFYVESKITSL